MPCLKATYFYLGRAGTLLDNPLVTDPLTHLQETVTPKVRGDRDVYGNIFSMDSYGCHVDQMMVLKK